MNAFIGRFTLSMSFLLIPLPGPPVEPGFEEPELEQEWFPERREVVRGLASGRRLLYLRLLEPADPCVWWWDGMPCVEFGVDEGVGGVITDRGACGWW